MAINTPTYLPGARRSIQVVGGENLFRIAELYLGDATQWWRIAALNFYPGEQPDFILNANDANRLNGTLLIPSSNPNATWP